MNEIDKLNYLNKYTLKKHCQVKIVSNDEILKLREDEIPCEWKNAFAKETFKERKEVILSLWNKYVSLELSNTISYLKDYCIEIELIKIGDSYSLLYSIKNLEGEILFYEGKNPKEKIMQESLSNAWTHIPEKIKSFYTNVHSGFFYYSSKSMGLNSYENILCLNDYEWGILDEINAEDIKLDLNTSYTLFSNGMGMYVVIDYSNSSDCKSILWSSKEEPEYDINFWDIIDEWIVIGFE